MCFCRCLRRRQNGEAVSAQAHIAKRCEGAMRRAEAKKKARRTNDAPSNKTYGNCLLGFHCSQKGPAANRAIAGFIVVAACQQEKLSTCYPQTLVDVLGTVSLRACHCQNRSKALVARPDSSDARSQSTPKYKCEWSLPKVQVGSTQETRFQPTTKPLSISTEWKDPAVDSARQSDD